MKIKANQLFPLPPINILGKDHRFIVEQRCYSAQAPAAGVTQPGAITPEGILLSLPESRKISALAYSQLDNKLFFFIANIGIFYLEPGKAGYDLVLPLPDAKSAVFRRGDHVRDSIVVCVQNQNFFRMKSYKKFCYQVGAGWQELAISSQPKFEAGEIKLLDLSGAASLVLHQQQLKISFFDLKNTLSPNKFHAAWCEPRAGSIFPATIWAVTLENEIIQYELLSNQTLQVVAWEHTLYFLTDIESGDSIALQGNSYAISYERKEVPWGGDGPYPGDAHNLYCGVCPALFQKDEVLFKGLSLLPLLRLPPILALQIGTQWHYSNTPCTLGNYPDVARYWFSENCAVVFLQTPVSHESTLTLRFDNRNSTVKILPGHVAHDVIFLNQDRACIIAFRSAHDSTKLFCYSYHFNEISDQEGIFLGDIPANSILYKYIHSYLHYYQDNRAWDETTGNAIQSKFTLGNAYMSFRYGTSFGELLRYNQLPTSVHDTIADADL